MVDLVVTRRCVFDNRHHRSSQRARLCASHARASHSRECRPARAPCPSGRGSLPDRPASTGSARGSWRRLRRRICAVGVLQRTLRRQTRRKPGAHESRTGMTGALSNHLERYGRMGPRLSPVIIFLVFGTRKFTAIEARGIAPLVGHSPSNAWLLAWACACGAPSIVRRTLPRQRRDFTGGVGAVAGTQPDGNKR